MLNANTSGAEALAMLMQGNVNSRLVNDFLKFKGERSFDARLKLVKSICHDFDHNTFKQEERAIIKEILLLLARNVEVKIRSILAEMLHSSSNLPHNVAIELANDLQEISSPILQNSPVLTDEDLIDIIKDTKVLNKVEAIAKRSKVNLSVSTAIVDKGHGKAVETLLKNKNAEINSEIKLNVVSIYQDNENILKTLISNYDIEPAMIEHISSIIGDHVADELVTRYKVKQETINDVKNKAGEEIALDINEGSNAKSSYEMARHLYKNDKLSHSIVLRSLSRTDLAFFEASLSCLADVSLSNTQRLINSGDRRGFSALYKAAQMPNSMFDATILLLNEVLKIREHPYTPKQRQRTLKEVLEAKNDLSKTPNINYFIALINRDLK